MRVATAFLVLFAVCYVECRKMLPLDKNANIAFINMEAGGAPRPANTKPASVPAPNPKPAAGPPLQSKPAAGPAATPSKPAVPVNPAPVPVKPALPPTPVKPQVHPAQPAPIQPKPVNPPPARNPMSTPGPGTVKQLVNFYDSQGKASPIRPYSYSQAVKQG